MDIWNTLTHETIPSEETVARWRQEPQMNPHLCRAADFLRKQVDEFVFLWNDEIEQGFLVKNPRKALPWIVRARLVDGVWSRR